MIMKDRINKRKKELIEILNKPKTPSEIKYQLRLDKNTNVSLMLEELADMNLTKCLNSKVKIGKLYGLTSEGERQRKKLLCCEQKYQDINNAYSEPSGIDWDLYSYIICGKQRRAILRALSHYPFPLKHIKKRAQTYDSKISRQNASDLLQAFVHKGIAKKIKKNSRVIFTITKTGRKLRDQLLSS